MSDAEVKPVTDTKESIPEADKVHFEVTNLEAAKRFADAGDEIQRFHLKTSLDIYDRTSHQLDTGTATYEKLILLNGGIIALSITFLGSLSSRFASVHISERPHLWLVATSWILLLGSMYCSYRVIGDRRAASIRFLLKVSSRHHQYIFQRLSATLSGLGMVIKGEMNLGAERVQLPRLLEALKEALKQEGDASIQKMQDYISEGQKTYKEPLFARLAIWFALLGITVLCLFSILSLSMLF